MINISGHCRCFFVCFPKGLSTVVAQHQTCQGCKPRLPCDDVSLLPQ
uniref:Uncharacterized protein n=1 Tax=Anguilla anguilla TaxID=7936 RepID=A0A0E9RP14_ANGAN